jgi:hypothetical protein
MSDMNIVAFPFENIFPPSYGVAPEFHNWLKIERAILKTPVKAVMPQIRLYDCAPLSMQRQLYEGLRHVILHGRLGAGTLLPSTRRLAKALGVSRNVVLFAYEELAAAGLVTSRTGSGTRVETKIGFPFLDPDGHSLHCLGGPSLQ